ncbi:MAG: hypothetical protein GY861_11800 [bacterium]|nr:hypothetical protein [bacterium]
MNKYTKTIAVRLDPEAYDQVKEVAKKRKMSTSQYIRTMVTLEIPKLDIQQTIVEDLFNSSDISF